MNEISIPNVAVLLAAYNGISYIEEQLKTISHQKDVNVTILISIDLSTDGTYEWCREYEHNHPAVTVLSYGERFEGAAKNFFRLIRDVDLSEYDYVAFADQDDVWLEDKLSHAVDMIQQHNVDGFSSDVIAFWHDGREEIVKKSYPQKQFDYHFEAAGPGCTYVLKHHVLQQFKCFLIENWSQVNCVALHDWMIYSYCRARGMKWLIDELPLMRYRQHDYNQVGFNSGMNAYLKRLTMVKDKWYRNEVVKIGRLLMPYCKTGFSMNRWFMVKHFWQLRRRPRDAYVLLIMLIIGMF